MARKAILIVGVSAFCIIGAGVWAQRPGLPPELLTSEPTPHPTFQPLTMQRDRVPLQAETPSQFFTRYLAPINSATRIEDLYSFWSPALITLDSNAKADVAGLKSAHASYTDVKIVSETLTTGGAKLTLSATWNREIRSGIVVLEKEGIFWKLLVPEQWFPTDLGKTR
jgi:hypothetical protein